MGFGRVCGGLVRAWRVGCREGARWDARREWEMGVEDVGWERV